MFSEWRRGITLLIKLTITRKNLLTRPLVVAVKLLSTERWGACSLTINPGLSTKVLIGLEGRRIGKFWSEALGMSDIELVARSLNRRESAKTDYPEILVTSFRETLINRSTGGKEKDLREVRSA